MRLYVLDSDVLSDLQQGEPNATAFVSSLSPGELAITVISVDEQLRGWYSQVRRAKKPGQIAQAYDRLVRSVSFLARTRILSFSEGAIARFENLRKAKLGVGSNDLRIAAIALEHDATVVTRNLRDFRCIPALLVHGWL